MRFNYIYITAILIALLATTVCFGGNKDRIGQAGASELLINPWARSSGFNGLNTSSVIGAEAIRINVAGLAKGDQQTEFLFARSIYLEGSEIGLNAAGFSQKVGAGTFGVSLMSVSLGEIEVRTVAQPEGTGTVYRPQFFNMGLSYSQAFTNSINGGLTLRVINEKIDNLSATGLAIDAGIQYVTGERDHVHFGITLRNVGTPMRFSGDGLTFKGESPNGEFVQTIQERAEKFELPSHLSIGFAYDFYLDINEEMASRHRLTALANFTSHSFSNDQIGGGLEYAFRERFMFRMGYNYEQGITDEAERSTVHTGLAGGFTFEVPVKADGPKIGIDYSYRPSFEFNGTHTMGVRVTL